MASIEEMKQELQELIERAKDTQDNLDVALRKVQDQSTWDAISVAAQTHRLDFASLLLASIAIILAVVGFIGFFEVRYRAKIAATSTAREECRDIAKEILKDYTNDELPDEVRGLVESIAGDLKNNGDAYGEQDTDHEQS